MRVALHVGKVWLVCTLIMLAVFAAITGGLALFQQEWRDRMTGQVHPVTVTVTGQHRNGSGCGGRIRTPGWNWEATWDDHGTPRHGVLNRCATAPPTGTRIQTLMTADGHLGGDTTASYYLWWPILSAAFGAGFTVAWLTGRGRPRFHEIRRT